MSSINRLPLPPLEYRKLVCGDDWELFEEHGAGLAAMGRHYGLLAPGARVLDVGCGCGRLARFLFDDPIRSYDGFDRHSGMISWCRDVLRSVDSRFRFHHVDVRSAYSDVDGIAGREDAEGFRFPFEDASFDSAWASSVFTHMPIDEVRGYLANLARVVVPGGRILATAFFAEGQAFREGLGFYLNRDEFLSALREAGFVARAIGETKSGAHQNWYLLERSGLTRES